MGKRKIEKKFPMWASIMIVSISQHISAAYIWTMKSGRFCMPIWETIKIIFHIVPIWTWNDWYIFMELSAESGRVFFTDFFFKAVADRLPTKHGINAFEKDSAMGKTSGQYVLLDTIGKCQRPVVSLGVSQHTCMHKITNRYQWKFGLNWSSNLQENKHPCCITFCAFRCII